MYSRNCTCFWRSLLRYDPTIVFQLGFSGGGAAAENDNSVNVKPFTYMNTMNKLQCIGLKHICTGMRSTLEETSVWSHSSFTRQAMAQRKRVTSKRYCQLSRAMYNGRENPPDSLVHFQFA